ncbi:hypothetical protein [Methylosinus sp. Sm6]|uniref:hypothetical protein n=1 Tax=Methylosinus sp. Sm6 TaxID=2866948 RepID=UPI001C98FA9E|nr:hypothetical protein [Methylosinus sp. Sm6]MBY6243213.1 hypothetical protein [Methylosinus sp. Sm6]
MFTIVMFSEGGAANSAEGAEPDLSEAFPLCHARGQQMFARFFFGVFFFGVFSCQPARRSL